MTSTMIQEGAPVTITDAFGNEICTHALSGVERDGHSFAVIWVERPLANGGTDRVPWPVEHVRTVT